VVADSFVEKDPHKVHDAIQSLIEGQNKQNPATLQRFFDQRDLELGSLKTMPSKGLDSSSSWEVVKKN